MGVPGTDAGAAATATIAGDAGGGGRLRDAKKSTMVDDRLADALKTDASLCSLINLDTTLFNDSRHLITRQRVKRVAIQCESPEATT